MSLREAKNKKLRELLEKPKEQLTAYELEQIVRLTHEEENARIQDQKFNERFRIYN